MPAFFCSIVLRKDPLIRGIHACFLNAAMDKKWFEYMVNRCYTMYMRHNNNMLLNLLDSHDMEKLMNRSQM